MKQTLAANTIKTIVGSNALKGLFYLTTVQTQFLLNGSNALIIRLPWLLDNSGTK